MTQRYVACSMTFLLATVLAPSALAAQEPSDGRVADALTLPTPRPLQFTTDEGTWMSVDLSPDGRTLIFDLLGDLYTVPIDGGNATRITSGQAFDAMPRFSPDGERIAFISDRSGASNLWIADADGSNPRPLSSTSGYWVYYVSPSWTPDGEAVVVSRNNGPAPSGLSNRRPTPYDLYRFSLEGGAGERLTGAEGSSRGFGGRGDEDHFGVAFAGPDRLWYSTAGESAQLHTMDLATKEVRQRTRREGGAVRPILSHDGRWLVYATRAGGRTSLRLRDLSTGDERWLVREAQRDQMSSWPTMDLMPGMAFTPDDDALITTYGGKIWRIAVPSGRAVEIPFRADVDQAIAASSQSQYVVNDSVLRVRQIRSQRLSPDGRRVAFVALDRVWVAELPRTLQPGERASVTARRISDFEHTESSPAWSPDGRRIAFVTWNDSTGGDIYTVDPDGGTPRRLSARKGFFDKLAYTPDGQRLLFAFTPRRARFEHDETGFTGSSRIDADLFWMPSEGGEPRHVTRLRYLVRPLPPYGVPHFGPDEGRVLVYEPQSDGLISMGLDGTDRRLVAGATQWLWNDSGTEPARDMVVSPTGRHIAILGNQEVFLADLDLGAPAPSFALESDTSGAPVQRISDVAGGDPGWSRDGSILHFSFGSALFLYDVARAERSGRSLEPARVDIEIRVAKDRPEGVLVLRGARVITMSGDEVIERGDLVIDGNRISAVGASGTVPLPENAEIFDLRGRTIVPGFVDTHAHIGAIGWGVHRTEPWQLYANLAHGVTTLRDPQTMTTDLLDYADRVEIGDILGPRVYTTGRAFFASDPVASRDDAMRLLRRNAEFLHTETVKLYAVGDRRHQQWYVGAARELGLSPTAEGDANFLLNLTHMMDGFAGTEHTLPTHPLQKDVVRLAVESGITYTPALTVSYGGPTLHEYFTSRYDFRANPRLQRFWPRSYLEDRVSSGRWRPSDRYGFPLFAADAARIAAAGGRVAVGSHGNLQGIGLHLEMWGLEMGGMPAHEVLRSATLMGAHAIGHERDLGSIEPGKLADLLVLSENPLDDIRNTTSLELVMKNGRLFESLTLDEIWPEHRPLSRQQWWMAEARQ